MNSAIQKVAFTPLPPVILGPGISIVPLIQLQADLEPFDVNVEDIEGQVERAAIGDAATYQGGSDILSAIQGELRRLEEKRTTAKKPADDYGKMVQKLCTPISNRLEGAKSKLAAKMLVWRNAEDQRLRAAQEAIRKQQQEEADRLAAEARARGNESTAAAIENMVAQAPTAPAPRIGTPNYTGKTHGKRVYWNGEAVEPMVILKNIIEGKIPISAIEFNKSTLNRVVDEHVKRSHPEGAERDALSGTVYLGIKISKDEKLV